MTEYSVEKFFDEYALKKEDTIIVVIDSGTNAKKICNLLNEQEEELKILRRDKLELEKILSFNDEYSLSGKWNKNLGIKGIRKGDNHILTPTMVVNRLNDLSKLNKRLNERNQRQYERLKEITDLMSKRDWETLEKIVEDWEQTEELLQAEFGNYGGVDG